MDIKNTILPLSCHVMKKTHSSLFVYQAGNSINQILISITSKQHPAT